MLSIRNLSFSYNNSAKILDNISLDVQQGEVLGIIGPNGTGKTTFIKCINRILQPTSGKVSFDGEDLASLKTAEIAKLMAYVPQYTDNFFSMTVVDTVLMGRIPYAGRNYTERDRQIVFDVIRKMNLEEFAFRNIKEMSGGERQRVYIARALAQQPKLIILDEPTSSLDIYNQLFILHIVAEIARENNISIIMIVHDLNLASMFCDKILMLRNTRVFAYGRAQNVLNERNINEMYGVNSVVTIEDEYKHIRVLKNIERQ